MKLSFLEHVQKRDYEASLLAEKQIIYGKNENYGQIVFLAGGAASGKGFAIKNFMHSEKFKIRDVDELKKSFQKLDELGKFTLQDILSKYGHKISPADMKKLEEVVISKGLSLSNLNLKNSDHVYILHILVRATGAKDKTLDLMLDGAKKHILPNILLDTTFADMGDVNKYVPKFLELGYDPKNIHITWVLQNFEAAVKLNAKRERVVPYDPNNTLNDVLKSTHVGAARTMFSLITRGLPQNIDGGFYVILNNEEETKYLKDPKTGKNYKNSKGKDVIEKFTYLTLKKPGRPMTSEADVKKQLFDWIQANVPSGAIDPEEIKKQL